MKKTLILYATHEINDNMIFFCRNGYIDDPAYDFVFVFNNPTIQVKMYPEKSNVRIMTRENKGMDFGAWTEALFSKDPENTDNYLYEKYDYFVFINSTVRGPFFPLYYDENKFMRWPDLFISRLNDQVKLTGTSINLTGLFPNTYFAHLQSMFMVTDRIGLDIGIKHKIFDPNTIEIYKILVICNKEYNYSKVMIDEGYNINCLLPPYRDLDLRNGYESYKSTANNFLFTGKYYGTNINPYEVIFMKENTKIDQHLLELYTKWHFRKYDINKITKVTVNSDNIDKTEDYKQYFSEKPYITNKSNIPEYETITIDFMDNSITIDKSTNLILLD